MKTHEVFNQPPRRVEINEYEMNTALRDAVDRYDAGWSQESLAAVGSLVGTEQFQDDARRANRHEPILHTHDRQGHRIDEVEYDPSYHRVIGDAIAHGAHTSAYANPRAGANVARAATFMLFAQIEPGHSCPVSMTHSAVPVVAQDERLAEQWMPRLLSTEYSGKLAANKPGAVFGMAMTEKQGGSDVRANSTTAEAIGDGKYRLTGHKWFCSAPMSDAFLVLAQAPAGVTCFLVPRVRDDGTRNEIRIMRLKDKVGNRSNASSEVEYEGAIGHLVGAEGRGVRTIIDMVTGTRLDSILGSVAGMRQATAEAAWHVRSRSVFGRTLVDLPAMTGVVADLQLETEAATETALRIARTYDDDASAQDVAFRRLATAVAKYWICKRGPGHAYEAMECLGGNGVMEDFPLAMRYREQPIMAVWEGSGNVIALDVLRAMTREPDSLEAFDAEVALAVGVDRRFDAYLDRTRTLAREISSDPQPDARARQLVASLAITLQGSLLLRSAPAAVADGFVASRMGDGSGFGHLYGALPSGVDAAAIVARA